jgi:hypothetical protein
MLLSGGKNVEWFTYCIVFKKKYLIIGPYDTYIRLVIEVKQGYEVSILLRCTLLEIKVHFMDMDK